MVSVYDPANSGLYANPYQVGYSYYLGQGSYLASSLTSYGSLRFVGFAVDSGTRLELWSSADYSGAPYVVDQRSSAKGTIRNDYSSGMRNPSTCYMLTSSPADYWQNCVDNTSIDPNYQNGSFRITCN
jgi:hypothetical protein